MESKPIIFKSYEAALAYAGDFGRYQKLQFILLNLIAMVGAFHGFNMVFIGATPDHHCNVMLDGSQCNLTRSTVLRYTIPKSRCNEKDKIVYKQCSLYNVQNISELCASDGFPSGNFSMVNCPNGWEYSKQYYKSTIVTQWDLVCPRYYRRHLADILFFSGRLFGALLFGRLADSLGRKPVLIAAALLQAVLGVVTAFSPFYQVFATLYFFQGIFQCGTFILAFVYITEIVGPSQRKLAAISNKIFYCGGQILLVGLAALLQDWKYLELAISVPGVLFISYIWLISESGRWLLSTGKIEEATKLLQNTAKYNGQENYKLIRLSVTTDTNTDSNDDHSKEVDVEKSHLQIKQVLLKEEGFRNLFTSKTMLKISLTAWFCWFVNSSTYVGMALITRSLNGNPYVNFLLTAVVELPALGLALVVIDRLGRKPCIIAFATVAGIASLVGAFVPGGIINTSLVLLTKFGISGSYAILFLVSAELFPTSVRNMAVGTAAMCGHLGGIVAPVLLSTRALYTPFPMIVFGVACLLSAFATLLLPETLGSNLPQTIADIENLSRPKATQTAFVELNSIVKGLDMMEAHKNLVDRSKAMGMKEGSFGGSINSAFDNGRQI